MGINGVLNVSNIYFFKKIWSKLNHFAVYLKLTQHCKSTIFQKKKLG